MIKIIASENRRATRLELYKDVVFLISHEILTPLLSKVDLVSLFASADEWTQYLTKNGIDSEALMKYEVDDLKNELEDDADLFVLLVISYLKLSALRKVCAIAKKVMRALVPFCQKYEQFNQLLNDINVKEKELRKEDKIANLLEYELRTLLNEEDKQILTWKKVVRELIIYADQLLGEDKVLGLLTILYKVNITLHNALDEEVKLLEQVLRNKQQINILKANINVGTVNELTNNGTLNDWNNANVMLAEAANSAKQIPIQERSVR